MTTGAGGKFLLLGLLVWMTAAVGPWPFGLFLFMAAWIINLFLDRVRRGRDAKGQAPRSPRAQH